jgi:hypothetical protein
VTTTEKIDIKWGERSETWTVHETSDDGVAISLSDPDGRVYGVAHGQHGQLWTRDSYGKEVELREGRLPARRPAVERTVEDGPISKIVIGGLALAYWGSAVGFALFVIVCIINAVVTGAR